MVGRIRGCGAVTEDWVETVATLAYQSFPTPPLDAPRAFASWLSTIGPEPEGPRNREGPVWQSPRSRNAAPLSMGPMSWPVPPFVSVAELADAWDEPVDALRWLADRPAIGRTRVMPPDWNYRYRWVPKRAGGWRLIEAPRPRLAQVQRRLLHDVLDRIANHPCAYGFVSGRSVADFAAPHVGRGLVIRIDLEDFFPSVGASRVYGIFRAAGYPEPIAHLFTAIATTRTPRTVHSQVPPSSRDPQVVDRHRRSRQRLADAHLPQGAPTSPSLANLAAFRLDQRLAGLAARVDARYSRYADDLVFSWPADVSRRINVDRWAASVARIAVDEQFQVNETKTRAMRPWQRQEVGGIVVNERLRVSRRQVDRVRAMVHCAATGGVSSLRGVPPGIDPTAHLLGFISWIEFVNPSDGTRLRADFARIDQAR